MTILQRTGINRTSLYLGTINNTPQGKKLVSYLSFLLKPYGKVNKMGRHPDRKRLAKIEGLDHTSLRRNVPIHLSTRFDVYLSRKNPYDNEKGLEGIPPYHTYCLKSLQRLVNDQKNMENMEKA